MGVFDGQPVNAAVTNPAFINKNIDDTMANKLTLARASSGTTIADIQAATNKLYAATGASESQTGTVYSAPANTITDGDSHQSALSKLAFKFDPSSGGIGHRHTGAPGDGPLLGVVYNLAASGSMPLTGSVNLVGGYGISLMQSGQNIFISASGGGGGVVPIALGGTGQTTANAALNALLPTQTGNAGKVLSTDGTNASWVSSSGGGGPVLSFSFANNQSSYADVTGFLVDPTSYESFRSDISIKRYISSLPPTISYGEDTAFYGNLGSAFNSTVYSFVEQPSDSKVLIGGAFTSLNGNTRNAMVRLNSDGTEDTSFASNLLTGFNDAVLCVALQSTGVILAGGFFTAVSGNSIANFAALNSDGTYNTTFNTAIGTSANLTVKTIAVQSDNKIVLGGAFTSFNGSSTGRIIRLNFDGTIDTSFLTNLGTGADSTINSIWIQADGKILVGGDFGNFNGSTAPFLIRLNSDGTVDSTFLTNLGSGFDSSVLTVQELSDTSIGVGGSFTQLNGNTRQYFTKLNSDGTENSTFATNFSTTLDSTVYSQTDYPLLSFVVLGGSFTSPTNTVCGVNYDGTPVTDFNTGIGTGSLAIVNSVYATAEYQVLIGGAFSAFDGNTRRRTLRFLTTTPTPDESYLSSLELCGVYDEVNDVWTLSTYGAVGVSVGVSFQMTDLGQLQYTSTNLTPGTVTGTMKFLIRSM